MATGLAGRTGSRGGRSSLDGKAASSEEFRRPFWIGPNSSRPTRRWNINHTNHPYRRPGAPPSHSFTCAHSFPARRQRSPLAGLFDLLHMNRESTPSRSKMLETNERPTTDTRLLSTILCRASTCGKRIACLCTPTRAKNINSCSASRVARLCACPRLHNRRVRSLDR